MLDVLKGPEHPIDVHLAGRPLVLILLVYEGSVLSGSPHDGNAIAIGYQARGASALRETADDAPDERLELLWAGSRRRAARARAPGDDDRARGPAALRAEHRLGDLDVLARAGLVSATASAAACSTA